MRSLHWVFTLNNYTDEELVALRKGLSEEKVRYAIFGKEVGESGTPHLQGYISFKKRNSLKGIKEVVGDRAHVDVAKGDEQQNYDYCSKEDPEPEQFGVRSKMRKRNDLDAFKESVKSGERDAKKLREDHTEVAARYPRFFDAYIKDHTPQPDIEYHPLRDWQQDLYNDLKAKPDKRTITFIVDSEGNRGKTWFAQYYCDLHSDATILEPGKKHDMTYALPDSLRVLFINCTREQCEYLSYSFLESCKDGWVFSPKYESRNKRYSAMHVVVLMNQSPDLEKLSRDRYKIIELK